MIKTALIEVGAAIMKVLTEDTELMNKVGNRVYDYPKQSAKKPYVNIAQFTENPFSTFGRDGKQVTIQLSVWSEYEGFFEALEIYGMVNGLLENKVFPLIGHEMVYLQLESAEPMVDADGTTKHVPIIYNVLTQEGES